MKAALGADGGEASVTSTESLTQGTESVQRQLEGLGFGPALTVEPSMASQPESAAGGKKKGGRGKKGSGGHSAILLPEPKSNGSPAAAATPLSSETKSTKKLDPNAKAFVFNPNAKEFSFKP